MATGAPGSNGVWVYGEDDSEATFSALLNKAASTTNTQLGLDRARLAVLEQSGRIVQYAYGASTTETNISSTTPQNTGLSVSITPKFANSKIIIITSQVVQPVSLGNSYNMVIDIYKDTTSLGGMYLSANAAQGAGSTLAIQNTHTFVTENSPNTTSNVTYKTMAQVISGLRITCQGSGNRSTIIALEVKQ